MVRNTSASPICGKAPTFHKFSRCVGVLHLTTAPRGLASSLAASTSPSLCRLPNRGRRKCQRLPLLLLLPVFRSSSLAPGQHLKTGEGFLIMSARGSRASAADSSSIFYLRCIRQSVEIQRKRSTRIRTGGAAINTNTQYEEGFAAVFAKTDIKINKSLW